MPPFARATIWNSSRPTSPLTTVSNRQFMTAKELLCAGKVREAERALSAHLRDNPADTVQRTFLFELLCFSGQYERAEKQLGVLAKGNEQAEMGAVLYYSALHAEKTRHAMFQKQEYPKEP